MADLTDYFEDRTLNYYLNTGATQPTAVTSTSVRLHTGDPGEAGTANLMGTGTWTNYAHETVNNDGATGTYWSAASGGQVSNTGIIDFGTATVSGGPATATHVSVADQAGNVLFKGALDASKNIDDGDPVTFPSGTLVLTLA
jgi:hypothetical protein